MPSPPPPDAFERPRFAGVRTFMRLPHRTSTEGADYAFFGLPFDTGGTYRVGARFGPEAIRRGSMLLRPYNPAQDVDVFARCAGVDYGDLPVVPGDIEGSYERIEHALRPIVENGVVPVAAGGDHSVTLPELRVLAERHGRLGLVQVDAHPDTWDEYWGHRYGHGTVVRRAFEEELLDGRRVVQVGLRGPVYGPADYERSREMGFEVIPADEVRRGGVETVARRIRDRIGDGPAFLSFDIDAVDPAFAPGTGTPEVGGLTSREALALVRGLAGLDFVGFDVVEVIPAYDVAETTAMLAANVAYEFVTLLALARRDGPEEGEG